MANNDNMIKLEFTINENDSQYIKDATQIANAIINTKTCIALLNGQYLINATTQNNLKNVKIKFAKYKKNKRSDKSRPLAWTLRGGKYIQLIRKRR